MSDRFTIRSRGSVMAVPGAVRRALFGATAVTLIALQVTVPGPTHSLLWSEIFNAGHAPLYGVVALILLQLLRLRGGGSKGSRHRFYLLALVLTITAGGAAECIQLVGPGDADVRDLARDALGAAAFLLAASAFDAGLMARRIQPPRAVALFGAGLLLMVAFFTLGGTVLALLGRDAAFPTICDFDGAWEAKFIVAQEATLERTPPPAAWVRAPAGRVGCLAFQAGRYPGLAMQSLHPTWAGYHELAFEAYSELPQPVQLVLSIHDIDHEGDYYDRFNRDLTIQPGANHISISLQDMRKAPRGREMDLSRMCGLVLFADRPSKPFVLYLDAFRLE